MLADLLASGDIYSVPTSIEKTEIVGTFLGFIRINGYETLRTDLMNRQMELEFQVERLQDVAVVNCSGRMVRGAALDELRRRVEQLTEQHERVRVLVLDVSDVDHLDAGGLGTLLLLRRWAARNGATMKLVNPPVFFRRVLEATHLNSVFEISSLQEAICILRAKDCQPARFAVA